MFEKLCFEIMFVLLSQSLRLYSRGETKIIDTRVSSHTDTWRLKLRFSEHTGFCPCKRIGPLKWLDISDYNIPTFRVYIAFLGRSEYAIV